MCSRPLKLAPSPTRSLLPSQFYLDHSHCPVLAPATLAALPSTRAIPDRDVFYVAFPKSSIRPLGFPLMSRSARGGLSDLGIAAQLFDQLKAGSDAPLALTVFASGASHSESIRERAAATTTMTESMHRKRLTIDKRAGARNGPILTRCCAREHVKRPIFVAL